MNVSKQILEVLRDPIWQFIGTLVSAISAGIAVFVTLWNRRREQRKISFEVVADTPLLQVGSIADGELRVLYGNEEVTDLRFIQYRIGNTGAVEITRDEIEEPIRILVPREARILESGVVTSHPVALGPPEQVNDFTVELPRCLLNPGDHLVGKLVVADSTGRIEATARIAGVKQIDLITHRETAVSPYLVYGLISLVVTALVAVILNRRLSWGPIAAWSLAASLVAYSLVGYDKALAVRGEGLRVPEFVFYVLSVFGGSSGVLLGIFLFRHKSRIWSFVAFAAISLLSQLALAVHLSVI